LFTSSILVIYDAVHAASLFLNIEAPCTGNQYEFLAAAATKIAQMVSATCENCCFRFLCESLKITGILLVRLKLVFQLGAVYWIFGFLLSVGHFETIIDSICSPLTNTCFVVTDAKGTDGGYCVLSSSASHLDKFRFYRQIFIKDIKDDVESQVRLLKPEGT
jgi:hypothetical protein